MVDISREGNEQFAGECYDRDAADPAALGADALAEPTAESTGGLVSHPHPGKLDHCGTQTRIACLRDALFVVDAATLPWTGEPGRHRPPIAVGSQSGGTNPQGRGRQRTPGQCP